jgi:hypothetical protein
MARVSALSHRPGIGQKDTPWTGITFFLRRPCRNRPLFRQAGDPCHRSCLDVEQPIRIISVSLTPLLHVFRHPARCWASGRGIIRLTGDFSPLLYNIRAQARRHRLDHLPGFVERARGWHCPCSVSTLPHEAIVIHPLTAQNVQSIIPHGLPRHKLTRRPTRCEVSTRSAHFPEAYCRDSLTPTAA